MIFTIDGSTRLPKSFHFLKTIPYFYDLVLSVVDERLNLPSDDSNMTISSDMITPNAMSSPNETLNFSADVSGGRNQSMNAANETSTHSGELVEADSLHWSQLNSSRESSLREGSSLHEQTNSTFSDAILLNNSTVMSKENNDGGLPAVLYWEKECHRNLLAQHSAVIRDILIKAWNEIDKKRIEDHAEISDPLYRAAMCKEEERRFLRLELKDIRTSSLEIILHFIYNGQLRCEEESFGFLLDDANRWGFELVVELCQEYLAQPKDFTNWDNLLICGYNSGNDQVVLECFKFFTDCLGRSEDAERVMQTMDRLSFPILLKLMKSDVVQENNAEAVFNIITTWVQSDTARRLLYLYSLIEPKLHLLSNKFLLEFGKSELINLDSASFNLIMKTYVSKQPSSAADSSTSLSTNFKMDSTLKTLMETQNTLMSENQVSIPRGDFPSNGSIQTAYKQEVTLSLHSIEDDEQNKIATTSASPQSDKETLIVMSSMKEGNSNSIHEFFDAYSKTWREWKRVCLGWGFEAQVVGDMLVCIGGATSTHIKKSVNSYNFNTNKWTSASSLNIGRSGFGSCVHKGISVLVCGGRSSRSLLKAGPTNTCEILHLSPLTSEKSPSGEWKTLPPFNEKRHGCSAVSLNNSVYVIGGETSLLTSGKLVTSTVELFDFKSTEWKEVKSMSEPRAYFAVAVHQELIYVFGGRNENRILQSCERYDPKLNTWEYIPSLPSPRCFNTAGVLGEEIVIIGGRASDQRYSKVTFIYDTQKETWFQGSYLKNELIDPKCVTVKERVLGLQTST